jgi:hypothetical protein
MDRRKWNQLYFRLVFQSSKNYGNINMGAKSKKFLGRTSIAFAY